jgi:hypothetical protein
LWLDPRHAYLSGHKDGIAITRSNREPAKKSRYHPKAFGKTLPRVLNHLASREMEFIEQQLGFKHEFADRHQRTLLGERRLRRVFTQSSFRSGGRLFGGPWQRMKKEQRLESLRINEERVIELEFGQMAPRMLYGMVGVTPPMADAYLVPGFGDPQGFRDGFKKLFSSLPFAEKPLERKPQGTKELLPKEPVQVLVQRLQDHHPQIAHFFGSGRGHELQFRESEIMVEILLRLQAKDIVALPVHDAVIVPSYAEEVTRKVMSEVFLEKVGLEAITTTTS